MLTRWLKRQHSAHHTEESWEAYRVARNRQGRIIDKALQQAHRAQIEKAASTTQGLWNLARWAKNRTSHQSFTLPIRKCDGTLEDDPSEKATIFRQTFFPQPPEADLSDLQNCIYPPHIEFSHITIREVE